VQDADQAGQGNYARDLTDVRPFNLFRPL